MEAPLVLFDGECRFCNGSVNFILDHERRPELKFAPLQSAIGQEQLRRFRLDPHNLDTLVLVDDGRAWTRSSAAARIARRLRFPWSLLALIWIIPGPLRDAAYNLFARNRYRMFGRQDACRVPTPELRERFLG